MVKTKKRQTKKQILIEKKEVTNSFGPSGPEFLVMLVSTGLLVGLVITAIPWVLNAAFWVLTRFFEYWAWVSTFF